MYLFLPKNINVSNLKIDHECTNSLIRISLPNVSSKLIGNISYFFDDRDFFINILLF